VLNHLEQVQENDEVPAQGIRSKVYQRGAVHEPLRPGLHQMLGLQLAVDLHDPDG